MTLLYHKFYNEDLSETAENGSLREVRMSWSHVSQQTKETVVVLLLISSQPQSTLSAQESSYQKAVTPSAYALKILLFTPATDASRDEEEEICSALFELEEAPEPSVLSGTGGLIFVSTRHFFFLTRSGSAQGAFDGFVLQRETGDEKAERWAWQRKPFVARPMDDIPPLRHALGSGKRHILLLARTQVADSCESLRKDSCDVLMVACAADNDTAMDKNKKHNKSKKCGFSDARAAVSPSVMQRTHTFLVALLRWSALPSDGVTGSWELMHLFVDRAIPFQRYMHEAASETAASGAWGTTSSVAAASAEPLLIEPQHCSWCFVPRIGSSNADDTDKNTTHSRHDARVRGAIFAFVPDPLRAISVVCGSFDSSRVSYQLGFVSASTAVEADDIESPEELLWDLAEDTHTVRMIRTGRLLDYLASDVATKPLADSLALEASAVRRHKAGWMKDAGVTALLRFCVDFMDDDIACGGESGGVTSDTSQEQTCHKRQQRKQNQQQQQQQQQQHQGLHIVDSATWEKSHHGCMSLPRTLPWIGTMPLPIGHDSATALCVDETAGAGTQEEESPAMRFNILPTSLISAVSVRDHCHASDMRCFVSINALLNQTRLTYAVQTTKGVGAVSTIGHSNSISSSTRSTSGQLELVDILQLFPSDSLVETSSDAADEALAEWMARTAAINDFSPSRSAPDAATLPTFFGTNKILPELILHTAWRRIAMERHPSLAMTLTETQSLSQANEEEVQQLAESLRHFLLVFLSELDWLAGTDGADLLRGVVLLMMGAVNVKSDAVHAMVMETATTVNQSNTLLRDESFPTITTDDNNNNSSSRNLQRITPLQLSGVQLLLKQCSRWSSLVGVLFAFVNRSRALAEDDSIVLDDLLSLWTDEKHNEVLQQFREAQDPGLFLDAVSALAQGNVSPTDLATAACWCSPAPKENINNHMDITCNPFVTLLQLFIDVSVKASQSSVRSVMSLKQMILGVVQLRFPTHGVVPTSVLLRVSEFNFACLANWPLPTMGGALPYALLIHYLAIQASEEEKEDMILKESLANSAKMLYWICAEKEEQAMLVMHNLCTARVSLLDLALSRFCRCPAACARALHHILVLPEMSLLKDAFTMTDLSEQLKVTNVQMALTVWAAVIEGDETAAFNPKLLHILFQALENEEHADSSVLLDYLQPIFMTAIPRLLAAVEEDTDSLSGVLALWRSGSLAPEEILWVHSLSLESDSVSRVCLHTFQEIKHLLGLFEGESLEVQCLVHLFRAFRNSCSELLTSRHKAPGVGFHRDAVADEDAKTLSDGDKALIFAFNPPDMFFIALHAVNVETARFVVAAEVMRRSLRPFIQQRMECSFFQEDKVMTESEVNILCRNFINTTMESFEMVISSFEVTAPLYERTLILLFLDETVAYLNKNTDTNEGRISLQVRKDLLECTRRVALAEWTELHYQEKYLLRRVLSDDVTVLLKNGPNQECESSAVCPYELYAESEAHHCAMKEAERLQEILHQQRIDAEILLSVRRCFSADSPLSAGINSAAGEALDAGTADTLLLVVKEEAYVRQHTQNSLLQSYDAFISGNTFREALAVLYLALRDEQRRRVFVEYVLQQKDIIFTLEYTFSTQTSKACRLQAQELKDQLEQAFHRRLRFLCTQEREARGGVEAVYAVQRETLMAHADAQRRVLAAARAARCALAEAEELERDALYERCAGAELRVARALAERLDEEAWRAEEEQWAELQETLDAEATEAAGEKKGNAFLKWQERQLAAVKVGPSSAPSGQEAGPSRSIPASKELSSTEFSPAPEVKKITVSPEAKPHVPPHSPSSPLVEAFAPLIAAGLSSQKTDETVKADGTSSFPNKLAESSDSILNTLSWWQKQIISTVAPPPPSRAKVSSDLSKSESDHSLAAEKKHNTIGSVSSPLQSSVHEELTSSVQHEQHHGDFATEKEMVDDWEKKPCVLSGIPFGNNAGTKEKTRDEKKIDKVNVCDDSSFGQRKGNAARVGLRNQETSAAEKRFGALFGSSPPSFSDGLDAVQPERSIHNTTSSSTLTDGAREHTQRVSLLGKRRAPRRRGLGDVVSLDAPVTGDHSDFSPKVTSSQSSLVVDKQTVNPSLQLNTCKSDRGVGDNPAAPSSTREAKSVEKDCVTAVTNTSTASGNIDAKSPPLSLPFAQEAAPSGSPLVSGWDEEKTTVHNSLASHDTEESGFMTAPQHLCVDNKDTQHSLQKRKCRASRHRGLGQIESLDSAEQEITGDARQALRETEWPVGGVDTGAVPVVNNQAANSTSVAPVIEEKITASPLFLNMPVLADASPRTDVNESGFEEAASGVLNTAFLEEDEDKARFILLGEEQLLRGLILRRFVLEL